MANRCNLFQEFLLRLILSLFTEIRQSAVTIGFVNLKHSSFLLIRHGLSHEQQINAESRTFESKCICFKNLIDAVLMDAYQSGKKHEIRN
jgi:hypothetical protein